MQKIRIVPIVLSILTGSVMHTEAPGVVGLRNNAISKIINRVSIGGPAYWAGAKPGDKIISFKPETGFVGDDVVMVVKRGNQTLTFNMRREGKPSFDSGYSLTKDGVEKDINASH